MTDPHRPLKDAFSRFATGITVVTCYDAAQKPIGMTVNSFTSVSLEPPLVLWCIDRHSALYKDFEQSDYYGVSVLAEDQEKLSTKYATPLCHEMPEEHLDKASTSAPLLKGRLAGFECRIVDRVEAGDHIVLIGAVEKYDSNGAGPLLYVNRHYVQLPSS